jgi:hypothetical protein
MRNIQLSLNNIISRNIGDLRSIYQKFADYTSGFRTVSEIKKQVITQGVMWKILKDSGILSNGCSLGIIKLNSVELDRSYASIFKDDPVQSHIFHVN